MAIVSTLLVAKGQTGKRVPHRFLKEIFDP